MTGTADLLERVLDSEPPLPEDSVEAVFGRAEKLRRRRLRLLITAGVAAALGIGAAGYATATTLMPREPDRGAVASTAPAVEVDPALRAVRAVLPEGLRGVPREPVRGPGWRQFTVLDRDSGRPRGIVEISAYAAPDGLCFPVLADRDACARPDHYGDDVEFTRYTDESDPDWQSTEVIARRLSDGRVVVVQATGERGTGNARDGRPPLTPAQATVLAADPALASAFDPGESCNGPDPACPVLTVPVPVD